MQASANRNSTSMQRVVIFAIVGILLVVAAYAWGNRLGASSEPSFSQAPSFASVYGVAGARELDAAQLRDAAAVASIYAGFRGVAAARAADAANSAVSTASLQGVAAVRAVDAGW